MEVVVRAPVDDQVKDHKFFPALLRGIRGETVASKFALMKSSALMEGVPTESHTKEVSCVNCLYKAEILIFGECVETLCGA